MRGIYVQPRIQSRSSMLHDFEWIPVIQGYTTVVIVFQPLIYVRSIISAVYPAGYPVGERSLATVECVDRISDRGTIFEGCPSWSCLQSVG